MHAFNLLVVGFVFAVTLLSLGRSLLKGRYLLGGWTVQRVVQPTLFFSLVAVEAALVVLFFVVAVGLVRATLL